MRAPGEALRAAYPQALATLVRVLGDLDVAQDALQEASVRALKNSPQAMSLSKRAIWGSLEQGYEESLEAGWQLLRSHWSHPDFEEGPKAFAEKREPVWNPDPDAKQE